MRIVVKSLDKILANGILKHINRIIYYDQEYNKFIPGMQSCYKIWKSIYVIHHVNKLK